MNNARQELAEKLLAIEESDPARREQHEKELHAMLENKLSAKARAGWLVGAVVCLLLGAFMAQAGFGAFQARTEVFHLPAFIGAYLLLTAAALLGVVGIFAVGVWRGGYPRSTLRNIVASLSVAYAALTGWILMLGARFAPELFRDDLLILGFILLLYAATAWVRHRIAQAELATREKLLEIELGLAEIAAVLNKKQNGG